MLVRSSKNREESGFFCRRTDTRALEAITRRTIRSDPESDPSSQGMLCMHNTSDRKYGKSKLKNSRALPSMLAIALRVGTDSTACLTRAAYRHRQAACVRACRSTLCILGCWRAAVDLCAGAGRGAYACGSGHYSTVGYRHRQ